MSVDADTVRRIAHLARIAVEDASEGRVVEVGKLDGHMKRLPATITTLPFLDPKREKPRA